MVKILSIVLLVSFIQVSYGFAEKYQVVTEKGESGWRIVISDAASPSEKYAASELQKFLKDMSGAELPIVMDKEPISQHEIILGDNTHLRQLGVKIDFEKLGVEGCTIRTVGDSRGSRTGYLVIAGSKKRGTLYGVYTFMEKYLGWRWFFMYPTNVSRIPKVNRIEIGDIDWTQIPALKYRHIGPPVPWCPIYRTNKDIYPYGPGAPTPEELGGSYIELEGHTFYMLVPPEKYFKEHPEYYSEIDGKRVIKNEITGESAELCLTNPDVLRIATEGVQSWIRQHPEIDVFSVSQMDDTGTYCRCANCRAIDEREGTPMGSILTFVNKIAEEIEKEFPGKEISTLSYTYSIKPPKTIKPRKNVIIYIAPIGACFSHPMEECEKNVKYKETIEAWHKLGARIYILDYAANFAHYLLYFANLGPLKANTQFYVRNGVVGILDKRDTAIPVALLRGYLLSKLFVDPDYDVDVAKNEFLDAYYGKAAPLMRQYLDMLNDKIRKDNLHFGCFVQPTTASGVSMPLNTLLTPEIISRAEKLFDEAEKLVQGDNEKLLHVQKTRLGIWYFQISTMSPDDPKRTETITKFLDIVEKSPEIDRIKEGGSMEGYKKKLRETIVRNVRCGWTRTPPKIDGILDDECWREADMVTDFTGISGQDKPDVRTEVKILYDKTSLYAGYTCYEPDMQNLTAKVTGKDLKALSSDDSVELFLDTKYDRKTYYQLAVSVAGGTLDSKLMDPAWDSDMEVKVGREKAYWTAEIRVPFSVFGAGGPRDGSLWGVNFCRNRLRDKVQNQSWSHVFDTFHSPNMFGNMTFRLKKSSLEGLSERFDGITTGDIDGDGFAEIIAIGGPSVSKGVIVLKSTPGTGTTDWTWTFNNITVLGYAVRPSGESFDGITTGDVDGDGRLEIVATGGPSGNKSVSVLKYTPATRGPQDNGCSGWTGANITALGYAVRPSGESFDSITTGDVDGDGRLEIIVTGGPSGNKSVSVLKYTPATRGPQDNGCSGWTGANITALGYATSPEGYAFDGVTTEDVDGDGKLEVITIGSFEVAVSEDVIVFKYIPGKGTPWFTWKGSNLTVLGHATKPTGETFDGVTAGDVDGDGKAEIVVIGAIPGPASGVVILKYGAPNPGWPWALFNNIGPLGFATRPAGETFKGVTAGDIDGDGKADIILIGAGQAADDVGVYKYTPDKVALRDGWSGSNITVLGHAVRPTGETFDGGTAGDVDKDKKADIILTGAGQAADDVGIYKYTPDKVALRDGWSGSNITVSGDAVRPTGQTFKDGNNYGVYERRSDDYSEKR